jgi:hypothetical protein
MCELFWLHRRQSMYLFGRERRVADIPTDHPSCSKQHAVIQVSNAARCFFWIFLRSLMGAPHPLLSGPCLLSGTFGNIQDAKNQHDDACLTQHATLVCHSPWLSVPTVPPDCGGGSVGRNAIRCAALHHGPRQHQRHVS